MRTSRVAGLLFLATATLAQQQSVEITSEPSHHLVFQNEYVRVFDVTVAPRATTLIHKHNHDYLFVTLGDSDVVSERVGEKPAALQLTDGEVRFTQGNFAHAAINKSDRPFHNITIELLKPASHVSNCADACEISPPCAAQPKSACPATEKRISSDQWTVSMVTLPPSASLSKNANGPPQLLIAVSYIVLLRTAGTSGTNVMGTPGKLEWVPGGASPAFTNNGMKPVQFVTLEFNPEKQSQ